MTREEFAAELEGLTLKLDELMDKGVDSALFTDPGLLRTMDQAIANLAWVELRIRSGV